MEVIIVDINFKLLNFLNENNKKHYYEYGLPEYKIFNFLTERKPFRERQEQAINIIETITTKHGKKQLHNPIVELAKIEHSIRELKEEFRDHVVHAVLSFLLGIYINEEFLRNQCASTNTFQWKLAGLFHDVGYPVQISIAILKPFISNINKLRKELGFTTQENQDISFKIKLYELENLQNNKNSFDLIQECLDEWGLQIDAKKEYEKMNNSGNICHGIISSLYTLHVIDLMYEKNNPKREHSDIFSDIFPNVSFNQKYFERDIVSACSAIYIHNLPKRCFSNAKIDRFKAPIAFLLKLSDCLQEWERPSKEKRKGYESTKFDIGIDNNKLIFCADIPYNKRDKIKDKISSSLIALDVEIRKL